MGRKKGGGRVDGGWLELAVSGGFLFCEYDNMMR